MELAAAIDPALSRDRARGRGPACADRFPAPDRIDPAICRHLSRALLGRCAMARATGYWLTVNG